MSFARQKSSVQVPSVGEGLPDLVAASSISSDRLLRGRQVSATYHQRSEAVTGTLDHPGLSKVSTETGYTAGMAALTNPNITNASAAGLTGRSGSLRDYDAVSNGAINNNGNISSQLGSAEHRINIGQQPPYNDSYGTRQQHSGSGGAGGHHLPVDFEHGNDECAPPPPVMPSAKELILDAVMALICLAVAVAVEQVEPTHKFIVLTTLPSVSYPMKKEQVPTWSVGLYALAAPLLIFFVWKFLDRRRTWRDMVRIMLTFLIQLFATAAILALIKVSLGRLRPNFVAECWPDGVREWYSISDIGGYARCTTSPGVDRDIRKSFPSGHAGWSASGLGFVSFFLMGQFRAWVPGFSYTWRLAVSLIPAAGAVAVSVSRVVDYKHHPGDVWGGMALGFSIAYVAYRQLFQPFSSLASDLPKPQFIRR